MSRRPRPLSTSPALAQLVQRAHHAVAGDAGPVGQLLLREQCTSVPPPVCFAVGGRELDEAPAHAGDDVVGAELELAIGRLAQPSDDDGERRLRHRLVRGAALEPRQRRWSGPRRHRIAIRVRRLRRAVDNAHLAEDLAGPTQLEHRLAPVQRGLRELRVARQHDNDPAPTSPSRHNNSPAVKARCVPAAKSASTSSLPRPARNVDGGSSRHARRSHERRRGSQPEVVVGTEEHGLRRPNRRHRRPGRRRARCSRATGADRRASSVGAVGDVLAVEVFGPRHSPCQ